ncbi:FecCD family ABC transporter permease [Testudinibacter sp. P27/CKL/0425]
MQRINPFLFFMLCSGVLLVLFFTSLSQGAVALSWRESYSALLGQGDTMQQYIVQQLRLPRSLLCIAVGAILGVSGSVLQGLFRNPLADPGIIGISAGSALGAAVAIVLLPAGWFALFPLQATALFAFIGGISTTLLVYRIAHTALGTQMLLMLLSGIAIGSLAFALLGFLQFIADDQRLRDLSMWQLGSFAAADFFDLWGCYAVLILMLSFFMRRAQGLNLLLLGENEARHLGISVERLKRRCIYLTALGTASAVAVAGMIGFVGLIVPHICRSLLGPNHQYLIPASAVCGATLMLLADLLARTLASPAEIPVGIITALVGAPFFLLLLVNQRRKG